LAEWTGLDGPVAGVPVDASNAAVELEIWKIYPAENVPYACAMGVSKEWPGVPKGLLLRVN
jgi:hypothetical protein